MTGLFNYYSNKKGEFLKNLVIVEESSRLESKRGAPSTIVDHNVVNASITKNWISANKENSYFIVILHNYSFKLTSYSVRMRNDVNGNYPLEWQFSGSNNKIDWEVIHHRQRTDGNIGLNETRHYNVKANNKYACFRFMQIGNNSSPGGTEPYSFSMGKIEFFGTLSNFDNSMMTCYKQSRSFFSKIFLINVLMITS